MKRCVFFLAAAIFLLLPGCKEQAESVQFFAMDTLMSITAYGPRAGEAVAAARDEVNRLDALLSRTREDSALSRLNGAAGTGEPVELGGELVDLLETARTVSRATGGAFDVTIAPVMDAWGWTGESRRVPSDAELAELLPLVDDEDLLLDAGAGTAALARPGMAADLGGIGKGYAAGRAVEVLTAAGITSALLDLGRNITVVGRNSDGDPWRVGVSDPQNAQGYLCAIQMVDQTASTSSGSERYFEEDGVRYHHILDPSTGRPADTGLLSVTVVSSNPAQADALSTACFVLGPEASLELWRTGGGLDPFELVLCRADGTVVITEGLEEGMTFHGGEGGYVCEIARR